MFLRRIFYDAATGDVRCGYTMEGAIAPFTQERDAEVRGLTGCACMEWKEPDPDVEAAFAPEDAAGKARLVTVTVDVSGAEPQLVFAYEPMPEPGTNEAADMAAALALLGVAPEEV